MHVCIRCVTSGARQYMLHLAYTTASESHRRSIELLPDQAIVLYCIVYTRLTLSHSLSVILLPYLPTYLAIALARDTAIHA